MLTLCFGDGLLQRACYGRSDLVRSGARIGHDQARLADGDTFLRHLLNVVADLLVQGFASDGAECCPNRGRGK